MKKYLLTLICSLTLIMLMQSCANNNDTGLETTKENTIIKSDSLWVPAEWVTKFKDAQVKRFEKIDEFKEVGAKFKIECTSLYLNPNNSILIFTKITLLKGAKNCEFHGFINKEQYNQETGDNVKTFSVAIIDYVKKQGGGLDMKSKQYNLYSQGTIEEATPNQKHTVK